MSIKKRSIEELNLIEDFLFAEASTDKETAEILMRLIIERATNLKVGKLIIEPQKTINGIDTDCHGIRLDVSVQNVTDDEGQTMQLFDIEPNNIKKVHLPKRSRFYQALIDVKLLETGVDYDRLPNLWTIWILPYDPFGKDFMLYSVKNTVVEDMQIDYNDGVRKLFLYTKGKKGGTTSLKNLLAYLQNSHEENAIDEELKLLHQNIQRLKHNKEIGVKYMQMQEVIKYQVEEEVEEIIAELIPKVTQEITEQVTEQITQQVTEQVTQQVTEQVTQQVTEQVTQQVTEQVTQQVTEQVTADVAQRMAKLTAQLLAEERFDDLKRLSTDQEYCQKLLSEV